MNTNIPEEDFLTWNIHGHSFYFDIEDAETAARYENTMRHITELGNYTEESNAADQIRADCTVFRTIFTEMLGEEAEQLFQEMPDNRRLYFEIYQDFIQFVKRQTIAMNCRILNILKQYVPGMREGSEHESAV